MRRLMISRITWNDPAARLPPLPVVLPGRFHLERSRDKSDSSSGESETGEHRQLLGDRHQGGAWQVDSRRAERNLHQQRLSPNGIRVSANLFEPCHCDGETSASSPVTF